MNQFQFTPDIDIVITYADLAIEKDSKIGISIYQELGGHVIMVN